MITFWISHNGDSTRQDIALMIANKAAGWRETVTSTKGGGPSAPYFESFSSVHVLPEAGWTQELATHHGLMFGMTTTAVELKDEEYDAFISAIENRSRRITT